MLAKKELPMREQQEKSPKVEKGYHLHTIVMNSLISVMEMEVSNRLTVKPITMMELILWKYKE